LGSLNRRTGCSATGSLERRKGSEEVAVAAVAEEEVMAVAEEAEEAEVVAALRSELQSDLASASESAAEASESGMPESG
jgi:hypothetical protein